MNYNFGKIESKWQKKWENEKVFESKEEKKKKYYVLEMFPYPSGEGLHVGHAFNYSIGDVYARFKRMNGFNVLYPMGFDSFGLPAENAAIKVNEHPKKYTEKSINNFIKQLKGIGLSYDWSRMIRTSDPEYYKWNQYFFIKFFEKGLVYRKRASVNFCSKCDTVLANEQVHNGKCWRHEDTEVEIKQLEQWFLKTTEYAEELLKDIEKLEWPERIKIMQRNWIGRSEGVEVDFDINCEDWKIFTTRADTIFGVSFMVVSAQHPRLMELVTTQQKKDVEKFLKRARSTSEKDKKFLEKEGVFTGSYAINPANGEKVPVYVGNFVLAEYGSGMVMGVPAHDQRDFEFAKKYKIPMKEVVVEEGKKPVGKLDKANTNYGVLVNSGNFDGLKSWEAKEHILKYLQGKKLAKKTVNFKLRDWLVSRQRYWGTPIPMIYCEDCGIQPVNEKDLPVVLPEKVEFGKGNPLTSNKKFLETTCLKCKKKARRDTDTMDTFFDSSWYFLRFIDPKNDKEAFNMKKVNYWMPVDQYIGGAEHACMHLIYARFFTKALRDLGFFGKQKIDEPFTKLFNQGMLYGLDGKKMSKSLGNVILPEEASAKYGIDTARLFLFSVASLDKDISWSEKGIQGSLRFMKKVFDYFEKVKIGKSSNKIIHKTNKTVKGVTSDLDNFRYNLAVIKIKDFFESMSFEKEVDENVLEIFLKILHPFCPHVTEELWEMRKKTEFLTSSAWPKYDEKKIDEEIDKQEEIMENLSKDITYVSNLLRDKEKKKFSKVYVYVLPKEKEIYESNLDFFKNKTGLKINLFSVNEKSIYDPEGKSKKVKPGKPGIYLE
ncbi:MAG: leucine--tRNA ligase [Candidatus Pacearchaeota archaeon]